MSRADNLLTEDKKRTYLGEYLKKEFFFILRLDSVIVLKTDKTASILKYRTRQVITTNTKLILVVSYLCL